LDVPRRNGRENVPIPRDFAPSAVGGWERASAADRGVAVPRSNRVRKQWWNRVHHHCRGKDP